MGRKAVHIKILKMFSSNHAKYYNSLRDSNKILIRIFDFPEVLQAETAFFVKVSTKDLTIIFGRRFPCGPVCAY